MGLTVTDSPQQFSASLCHPESSYWLVPIPARDKDGFIWVWAKF